MAKKKEQPVRELTKRQVSHRQKEHRTQQIVMIAGAAIIAVSFLTMGIGWFVSQYRPMHEKVIRVNDTTFDMEYFIRMMQFYQSVQPSSTADDVVKAIQRNELIRQAAEKQFGVIVTEDEINAALASGNATYSKNYKDIVGLQILSEKLSGAYFTLLVPGAAEQRHVYAMLLENKEQADSIKARLEQGESFETLAEQYSLEATTAKNKGDMGFQAKDVLNLKLSPVVGEYAFFAGVGSVSNPLSDSDAYKDVGYWLVRVLEREDETTATVEVMLLGSEQEAKDVKAKMDAGEEFGTLAREHSQLLGAKDNSGYFPGLTRDSLSRGVLDDYIFGKDKLADNIVSPVLKDTTATTRGGYWLVKITEKTDNKPIDEGDRLLVSSKLYSDWVNSVLSDTNNVLESYLDDAKLAFAYKNMGMLTLSTGDKR